MKMNKWYECRIRYEKTMENGMQKKVTEPYLADAMSFTEAEARIIEEMKPFITGEFEVTAIKQASYIELFPSEKEEDGKWYSVRINFMILDERTGVEKKTKAEYLVQASDINSARDNFNEAMKATMMDYEITGIKETPVMDVYPYQAKEAAQ